MRAEIIEAIESKSRLSILYDDDLLERCIEPHAYGISTKGTYLLRAYQVNGPSDSGEPEGWKLFRVDRIASLETLDSHFTTRPGFKRGDSAMTQGVLAEV